MRYIVTYASDDNYSQTFDLRRILLNSHTDNDIYDAVNKISWEQEPNIFILDDIDYEVASKFILLCKLIFSEVSITYFSKKKLEEILAISYKTIDGNFFILPNCGFNFKDALNFSDSYTIENYIMNYSKINQDPLQIKKPNIGLSHISKNEIGLGSLFILNGNTQEYINFAFKRKVAIENLAYMYSSIIRKVDSKKEDEVNPIVDISIILIDDQFANEWLDQITLFLSSLNVNIVYKKFLDSVNDIESVKSQLSKELSLKHNFVVLLDLRLLPNEYNHVNIKYKDNLSGIRVLDYIKNEFPHIPVVIFTSSEKYWNYHVALDLGADGYIDKLLFHKILISDNFQKKELPIFSNINQLTGQYKLINIVYELIEKIENNESILLNKYFENKLKAKERVRKRLYAILAMCKRRLNNTTFYQKYVPSENEIIFILIWSCLIELKYLYLYNDRHYCKLDSDVLNNPYIKSESVKKMNIYYLTRNPHGKRGNIETNMVPDKKNEFILNRTSNSKNYKIGIGEHVAFILLNFIEICRNSSVHTTKVTELYRLKKIRNKLYFIHGEELKPQNYFNSAWSNQVQDLDIEKLFSIVRFLIILK